MKGRNREKKRREEGKRERGRKKEDRREEGRKRTGRYKGRKERKRIFWKGRNKEIKEDRVGRQTKKNKQKFVF
jgi:hypothetical protein